VNALSLEVPRGAVYGLLGPNGAGKTTTFSILASILRPSSGSARILGVEVGNLYTLRGRVAVLPQDAWFPAQVTIAAQLAHYARLMGMDDRAATAEAARVLAEVGLADSATKRGSELSHGMTKRVGIAAALIGNPEVLLLDEPTTGLDPRSAFHIKEIIARQAPRATVLVSSHQLADVQEICTHGAILDHGKLVQAGTIGELTRQGQELSLELGRGAPVPLAELMTALGGDAKAELTSVTDLRIAYDARRDPAEAIAIVLRVLLEHQVPILGLRRGTSLEKAFMAMTSERDWGKAE
jgi:ABC-type multidrug transport system ATPase subunit